MAPSSTSAFSRKPVATLLGPNPLHSQPSMNFASWPSSSKLEPTKTDSEVETSVGEFAEVDNKDESSEIDQPHPLLNIAPRPIVSRMGSPTNDNKDESSTTEPFPLLPYEMPDAYTIPLAYFIAALPRADYWRSHYLTMNNPQMPADLPFKVIVIGTEDWEEHDFVHARHILGIEIVGPGVPPLQRHVQQYSPSKFVVGAPSSLVAEMFIAEADANFFDGTDPRVDYKARRAQISRIRWSHLRCQIFEETPGDLHVDAQLAHIQDLQVKRARDFIQKLNSKEVRSISTKAETAAGAANRVAEQAAMAPPPVPRRPENALDSAAISQLQNETTATIVTGITRKGPNNTLTISGSNKQRPDNASVITKSSAFSRSALFKAASKTKAIFKRLGREYQE
ncbi:hypothetical protein MMC17_006009 [Xylographa soralifera]|nr:hypothetical protein [Xylographa soralifera]